MKRWTENSDSKYLFEELVRMALVSRFHTLFYLSWTNQGVDSYYTISLGRSFRYQATGAKGHSTEAYLRNLSVVIAGGKISHEDVSKIIELDRFVDVLVLRPPRISGFVSATDLDCPAVPADWWISAINANVIRVRSIKVGKAVFVSDFNITCTILTAALVNNNGMIRSTYLLSLLAVHLMRYDITYRNGVEVRVMCYRMAQRAFKDLWVALQSRLFHAQVDAEQSARSAVYFIRRVIDAVRNWKWLEDATKTKAVEKGDQLKVPRFTDTITPETLACSRYGETKVLSKSDLVLNYVKVYHRGADACMHFKQSPLLAKYQDVLLSSMLTLDEETDTVVVPLVYGMQPIYYATIERYVNHATLAVQVGRLVYDVVNNIIKGDVNETAAATYKALLQCHTKQIEPWGGKLTERQLSSVFGVIQSLKLAYYKRKLDEDHALEGNASRLTDVDKMFFKRSCITLCMSNDTAIGSNPRQPEYMDGPTAKIACLLGVANMDKFHEAFACKPDDRMRLQIDCSLVARPTFLV